MKKLVSLVAMTVIALCIVMPAAAEQYTMNNPPVIETPNGLLRGLIDDDGIFSFLGVQYATAERFGMPVGVEPWEGVKDAQKYGFNAPIPAQTAVGHDELVWPHRYWTQNESCQVLNVWTPTLVAGAGKPVMIFFHGGGFTNGSAIEAYAYEGANLAEYGDVVVVTVNHRLNVLGYLDLSEYGDEYKYSGNAGMADLVASLQWVHDNIAAFGGDPNNVFIFGQSGGGSKVYQLMHMPSAKGLFHKAGIHSGGGAGMDQGDARLLAKYTVEELGLTQDTIGEIKNVPYAELLAASDAAAAKATEETGRRVRLSPVVDEDIQTSAYQDFANDVPVIVGSVFSENSGTLHYPGPDHKKDWDEQTTLAKLGERFGAADVDGVVREFSRLFPEKPVADAYFYNIGRASVPNRADEKMVNSRAPVYTFLFAYEAPVNGGITAFHCSELTYVFHNVDSPMCQLATGNSRSSYYMQDVTSRAFVNFVWSGNPSQNGLEWTPYSETGETMVFDVDSECKVLDDAEMLNLMAAE